MTGPEPEAPAAGAPDPAPLIDFAAVAGRLRRVAAVAAVLAVVGATIDAVVSGLTVALVARWLLAFAGAALLGGAVVVALSALRGADRAQRRGERLAGDDVGLAPPRRPR